jgi:hypothetical protein
MAPIHNHNNVLAALIIHRKGAEVAKVIIFLFVVNPPKKLADRKDDK